jgi:hypothetical protein
VGLTNQTVEIGKRPFPIATLKVATLELSDIILEFSDTILEFSNIILELSDTILESFDSRRRRTRTANRSAWAVPNTTGPAPYRRRIRPRLIGGAQPGASAHLP